MREVPEDEKVLQAMNSTCLAGEPPCRRHSRVNSAPVSEIMASLRNSLSTSLPQDLLWIRGQVHHLMSWSSATASVQGPLDNSLSSETLRMASSLLARAEVPRLLAPSPVSRSPAGVCFSS